MGELINEFARDSRIFWPLAATVAACLGLFSILYNRWMDDLGQAKSGYTALLVALGNLVTLGAVSVLSWRAAAIVALAFVVSGVAMIAGDIRRHHRAAQKAARTQQRRRPLPYAAAGLIDDAIIQLSDAQRSIKTLLRSGAADGQKLGLAGVALAEALAKLAQARQVEGDQ